jgi:hypothetical protein
MAESGSRRDQVRDKMLGVEGKWAFGRVSRAISWRASAATSNGLLQTVRMTCLPRFAAEPKSSLTPTTIRLSTDRPKAFSQWRQ